MGISFLARVLRMRCLREVEMFFERYTDYTTFIFIEHYFYRYEDIQSRPALPIENCMLGLHTSHHTSHTHIHTYNRGHTI